MSVPSGGNQNHGYQGLGYFGESSQEAQPPGGEPPEKRTALMVAIVVAAVVAIGVAVSLFVVDTKKETTGEALPAALIQQAPKSTTAPKPSGKPNDPLQPQATGAPQVPGWKPIPIHNGEDLQTNKAYDVPPSWSPVATTAGFGQGDTKTTMYIPAVYMRGFCPSSATSFRSMAGLVLLPNTGDGPTQATTAAQRLSDAVFTNNDGVKPKIELGPTAPVTVAQDKKGVTITAKVAIAASNNEKDKCNATSAVMSLMVMGALPEDKYSIILVAFADQGFPEATPEAQLLQIVTSIHAAN